VPELSWSDGLLEAGFGDPQTAQLVGWRSRIARMVEVEAALARALATTGLMPAGAAEAITRACDPARLDLDELAERASTAATPVIPLVHALTHDDELVASWLHHGATSQDIIDTATALQLRDALDRISSLLLALGDRCAEFAHQHRTTLMAGRTLGQQATPITFGLKAARWLAAIDRRLEQLRSTAPRILTVQLGGTAGTAAVYGSSVRAVTEALGAELGLAVPDLPWHAERDRIVELAGALAATVTTASSIAGDLVLLAQSEIAEVREGSGPGQTSSAMPHKRNPTHAVATRAASRLALGELGVLVDAASDHELERAAGAWQAEWVALPSALVRTAGTLVRLDAALGNLEVDAARARENLDRTLGLTGSEALVALLVPELGRAHAQRLVAQLAATTAATGRSLAEVAADHPEINGRVEATSLREALDPAAVLASADELIDRALAAHDRTRGEHPG
jgi:3-carboxy-cis,cis-muconate cycloisomerase